MLIFREAPRRFICKRCGKHSQDEGNLGKEKLDKDVEFEFMDLCPKCFKEYRKETVQAYILVELVQKSKVSKEEMEKLYQLQTSGTKESFKKFKTVLLRRNEVKKGWSKNNRKLLIQKLLLNKVVL